VWDDIELIHGSRYAAGEPAFVQDDATTGTGGSKETACGASPAVSGAYVSCFYARANGFRSLSNGS